VPSVAEVVRRHGPAYLERHRASLLPSHVRALQDIAACRTPAMGGHLSKCDQCERRELVYHSCCNRACPSCGGNRTTKWLKKQRELLLPVPYFHVVFTLPAELRRLVRTHQRVLLPLLFRAAFESLAALCRDVRFVGGDIGALAVLHTWTRTLEWHPHVHLLVTAGGLDRDGRTWRPVRSRRARFLVPVRALSQLFRGRLLHLSRRALPKVTFPEVPWGKRWVVYAKPTLQGPARVLDYLGRYVHRTAISDHAVLACDARSVTFRYTDSRNHQSKTMTLATGEFLRRFLQHVLPKGFHRVRAFGLLHPRHRTTLGRLQLALGAPAEPSQPEPQRARRCPSCGLGTMVRQRRLSADECCALAFALVNAQHCAPEARAPP
jgi:hypothetical protein